MIVFDPYFVMYTSLVQLVGGVPVIIDTYPDFRIDLDKVAAAITPRTKLILLNSPANPDGRGRQRGRSPRPGRSWRPSRTSCWSRDEIYRSFCYDEPFVSPAQLQRPHARDRRLLQEPRHDRLAAGLRARAGGDHRHDDQAAAVHVRLRPAAGAVGRGRGDGRAT